MLKTVKTNLFCFTLLVTHFHAISNEVTLQYIQKYRTIAISEMQRTGIPASIKMAQAILESNSGQSTLAHQSNNHFGIKCGNDWEGKTVYRHDDDYHNGLLVRSCFRSYDDPYESYIAHSDFLANPYSRRYKTLFQLQQTDYTSWAYGLQKAGYATDRKYPEKLIDIIEKYQLYSLDEEALYDLVGEPLVAVEEAAPDVIEKDGKPVVLTTSGTKPDGSKRYSRRLSGNSSKHIVKRGEHMRDIAAIHRLDLRELYFKNRIPFNAQPAPGQSLQLDRYIHFKERPKLLKTKAGGSDYLFEETIILSSE